MKNSETKKMNEEFLELHKRVGFVMTYTDFHNPEIRKTLIELFNSYETDKPIEQLPLGDNNAESL